MKLVINGKFLSQRQTGVQNYASGIVKALIKAGINMEIVTPPLKDQPSGYPVKSVGFLKGFIWEQIILAFYMRQQKKVILLNLCNSSPLLIRQQVVTVHDLAFEEKSNWFNPLFKMWYRFMLPRICKRAQLIITVSEFSKRKIMDLYGIKESKIIIAPPGIPEFKFKENEINYGDYMVLTGVNNPRKNAGWIVKNAEAITKRGLKLVVLGEKSKVFRNISVENKESVIHLKHLSFRKYCSLLRNAKALIYPSLYEGFGIPVLESLCLGTPVIASDITVFRENFGELPVYFELGNSKSFENALDLLPGKKISAGNMEYLKHKFNFDLSASLIAGRLKTIM